MKKTMEAKSIQPFPAIRWQTEAVPYYGSMLQKNAVAPSDLNGFAQVATRFSEISICLIVADALTKIASETGGKVRMLPEYGCMPVLIGRDNHPVPLYEVVEEIDTCIDYEAVIAAFPTLTYTDIVSTMAFIRKVTQSNIHKIDVDEIHHSDVESDPDFQNVIRQALEDKGFVSVHSSY